MREDGFVSLWLGTAPHYERLLDYVQLAYNDDGEFVPSQFMRDFSLPRWDEACREAEHLESEDTSTRRILEGFSYEDQIVPQFVSLIGETVRPPVNAVVLLYNYNYQPRNNSPARSTDDVRIRFCGVVKFAPK